MKSNNAAHKKADVAHGKVSETSSMNTIDVC